MADTSLITQINEWLIDQAPDAEALADRMLSAGAAALLQRAEAMA